MIMIFNRYYRRGYGMARKYVKLISFNAEISHNIKDFLDKVYSDANKPLAVPLEESLSATLLNIKEQEKKIAEYKIEKESLNSKMSNADYSIIDTSQETLNKIKDEVEELTKKINAINIQISENQTEYIKESA